MSNNNSNKNPFKVHKTFETGNKRKAAGDLSPEEGDHHKKFHGSNLGNSRNNEPEGFRHGNPRVINMNEAKENILKYTQEYERKVNYYMYNEYTQNADSFLRKVAADKKVSTLAAKYPLLKILKSITKKFMLNDLEITFFALFLDENGWCHSELQSQCKNMTDFLNITEIKDHSEYKSLLLYLLLVAFTVKQYLNEPSEMEIFECHAVSLNSDFNIIYQQWINNNSKYLKVSPPTKINKIYKKYSLKYIDYGDEGYHEDFNALVDNIIQISPPYNNEKYDGQTNPQIQQVSSGNGVYEERVPDLPRYTRNSSEVSNFGNLDFTFSHINSSFQLHPSQSQMNDKSIKPTEKTKNEEPIEDLPLLPTLKPSESTISNSELSFTRGVSSYLN